MTQITLYSNAGCPYAQRSRIVLLEKALRFDYVEVDLANRPDWFAEVSPSGKVPVLLDGELRVYESAIINEYLDEQYPLPSLLPASAALRAEARLATHRLNAGFGVDMFWAAVSPDAEKRQRHTEALQRQLQEMEQLLFVDGREWWLGQDFTLVDIGYYTVCERLAAVESVSLSEYSRVSAWFDRVQQRAAVSPTILPAAQHRNNFAAIASRMAA